MPIRIVEYKPASQGRDESLLIGSEAMRLLEGEMQKYCSGRSDGGSFLIAGHRGAGKTTLVRGAIQRVENILREQRAQGLGGRDTRPMLRPLLVPLQGPNLLPPDEKDRESSAVETANDPRSGTASAPAEAGKTPDRPASSASPTAMETVLIQITLGLYRALANRFSEAYTAAVFRRGPGPNPARELELAAQFELDLDEYPGKARLREYWRRLDALESGILFTDSNRPLGNGFRELVALSSACEAYQRIAGHFSRESKNTSGANRESQSEFAIETKGGEFLKPFTALLAGGAVGAGFAAIHANPATAVCVGLLTALASSAVFRYSAKRSRQQGMNRSELFIPDLSVATLDRVLPVLIQRIVRAGLAPVFMVDELDKVDLSERITGMVKRLKKLVAEEAFFCFLTDRKYFEELSGRTADAPYSIEYTYYSHQLFIVYSHQDLHYYLSQVLQATRQPDAPAAVPNPAVSTAATGIPQPPQVVVDDDAIDTQILPYLILHASQMHTIDLRRQLRAIRNDSGEVLYKPGETRGQPRFRYALMVQLAVETALEHPDMRAELEQRPAFLQIARDALYYISRRWQHAPAILNLDDETGRAEFERYLRGRMATDANLVQANGNSTREAARDPGPNGFTYQQAGAGTNSAGDTHNNNGGSGLTIDPATLEFLFVGVRGLAAALADVVLVNTSSSIRGISQIVLDNLPREPLLHSVGLHQYRWQCFPSGREVLMEAQAPAFGPQPVREIAWQDHVGVIEEFDLNLAEISDVKAADLGNQFGILPTTPSWSEVRRACERLRGSERSEARYPDMEIDISVVREFHGILEECAVAIEAALLSAKILRSGSPWQDDFGPLNAISVALRLRTINLHAVEAKLSNLLRELLSRLPKVNWTWSADRTASAFKTSVSVWLKDIGTDAARITAASSFSVETIGIFKADAWTYWEKRLQISTIAVRDPGVAVIYCAVHSVGPGQYLYADPDEMGIGYWSGAFLAAFRPPSSFPESDPPPPWLAPVAVRKLGLEGMVSRSPVLAELLGMNPAELPAAAIRDPKIGVVFSSGGTHAWNWLPQPEYPLLYVDFLRIGNFLSLVPNLTPGIVGLNVALDGKDIDDPYLVGPDPKNAPPITPINPDVVLPVSMLGRDVTGLFPVIVSDPLARRNWLPNFRPVAAQNPQDLFRAFGEIGETAFNMPQ